MIKIMDEWNKNRAEEDGDTILKKEIEEAVMTASSEEFLACLFILLADNCWYKGLNIDLANDFTIGQSNYPKTVVAANRLLKNYIATSKINYVKQETEDVGIAFSKKDCDND